jgi:hypothetical protein
MPFMTASGLPLNLEDPYLAGMTIADVTFAPFSID